MLGGTHDTSAKKQQETAFVFDQDKPLDLVVLAVKQNAARCRTIDTQVEVNLRSEGLWVLVPGKIATVRPKKSWRFKG